MKIRVKFSKSGSMKFIGHLDIMRYFQRVVRRADVDIAYSEGFSPHQKMSFAAPLGVGLISQGEYFDIELNSSKTSVEMINQINSKNVDGINVINFNLLPDDAKNCMSIVAAADYLVHDITDFSQQEVDDFFNPDEIIVMKKTKKSEKEVNIKPMIYSIEISNNNIFMKVAQGSAANLKPNLVMEALYESTDKIIPSHIQYERVEMYCKKNERLISLNDIGGPIE